MMSAPTASYDVLIIGGGPAGLSAALTLSRYLRRVALFDSGLYRDMNAIAMNDVPTYDGADPEDFRNRMREELEDKYDETFTLVRKKVVQLVRDGENFRAKTFDCKPLEWIGRKVILATGIRDVLPPISGFSALWGTSILHGVFWRGTETRNLPIGVLLSKNLRANRLILQSVTRKSPQMNHDVTILANGIFLDQTEPQVNEALGIDAGLLELIRKKRYKWLFPPIESITPISVPMIFHIPGHPPALQVSCRLAEPLELRYLLCVPESAPHRDISPLLSGLKIAISAEHGEIKGAEGIYVAGNAGCWTGSKLISMAQGQEAALTVEQTLGQEDNIRFSKQLKTIF